MPQGNWAHTPLAATEPAHHNRACCVMQQNPACATKTWCHQIHIFKILWHLKVLLPFFFFCLAHFEFHPVLSCVPLYPSLLSYLCFYLLFPICIFLCAKADTVENCSLLQSVFLKSMSLLKGHSAFLNTMFFFLYVIKCLPWTNPFCTNIILCLNYSSNQS